MTTRFPSSISLHELRPDLQAIAELIPVGAKVLDLGCADGTLLAYLIQQKQVLGRGVELSEAGVLACVRRGLSVRQGNLQEGLADYPNASFDYVILSQTISFLNGPAMILREMLRVGRLAIVSFPNWGYWRYRLQLLLNGRFPQAEDFPPHWHSDRRWQAFTVADFAGFCQEFHIGIRQCVYLTGHGQLHAPRWQNLRAKTAVYALENKLPR